MGLDMWFYSSLDVPEEMDDNTLTENINDNSDKYGPRDTHISYGEYNLEEIYYFRKHSDLHGFLSEIWSKKTWNPPEEFNCVYLEITEDILDDMERLANDPPLTHYTGAFWGCSTKDDWKNTIDLIGKIKKEFEEGRRVFYYSWW